MVSIRRCCVVLCCGGSDGGLRVCAHVGVCSSPFALTGIRSTIRNSRSRTNIVADPGRSPIGKAANNQSIANQSQLQEQLCKRTVAKEEPRLVGIRASEVIAR